MWALEIGALQLSGSAKGMLRRDNAVGRGGETQRVRESYVFRSAVYQ